MKQFVKNYFFQNRIEYLKVFMVFIIGIVISIMIVNQSNNDQKKEIKDYIDNKIELVKVNNYENKMEAFKKFKKLYFNCIIGVINNWFTNSIFYCDKKSFFNRIYSS